MLHTTPKFYELDDEDRDRLNFGILLRYVYAGITEEETGLQQIVRYRIEMGLSEK